MQTLEEVPVLNLQQRLLLASSIAILSPHNIMYLLSHSYNLCTAFRKLDDFEHQMLPVPQSRYRDGADPLILNCLQ